MQQYIIELSKYGITFSMLLYTVLSMFALLVGFEGKRILYLLQCILLFLNQLICYLNLAAESEKKEYLFYFLFVQFFLLSMSVVIPMI